MKCIALVVLMSLAAANAFLAPLPIIAPYTVEQPAPVSLKYAPKITVTRDFTPLPVPYSYPVAYDTPLVYAPQYPSALQVAPVSRFGSYPAALPLAPAPISTYAPYPAAVEQIAPVAPILANPAVTVAEPTYIATNRGSQHIAPLPGHTVSVVSENLEPAPGTF